MFQGKPVHHQKDFFFGFVEHLAEREDFVVVIGAGKPHARKIGFHLMGFAVERVDAPAMDIIFPFLIAAKRVMLCNEFDGGMRMMRLFQIVNGVSFSTVLSQAGQ